MTASERVITGFVEKPCLLIDEQVARSNISRMAKKARENGVIFRPHFKTHQSETIGEWFWDEGVRCITVSSVDMADYFAACGWTDITIAAPVNLLQMRKINQLAYDIDLNLVVDSADTAAELSRLLDDHVGIFLKIDTGAGRCGLSPLMAEEIITVATMFMQSRYGKFRGLLVHSGHTYKAEDKDKIVRIWDNDMNILTELRQHLKGYCDQDIIISTGDTPGCTIVDDLSWADEIRPGNFVFYDLFQWNLGVCEVSDIACVMACPVISSYPRRGELVIYGGAVHFSKDFMIINGKTVYGLMGKAERNVSMTPDSESPLLRLWQEHGLISVSQETAMLKIPSDMAFVFPVHSCLTLDAVRYVKTTEGKNIRVMGK